MVTHPPVMTRHFSLTDSGAPPRAFSPRPALSSLGQDSWQTAWQWANSQLPAVQRLQHGAVSDSEQALKRAALYHLQQPGGQWRGRLTLAVAYYIQLPTGHSRRLAAACELLHNASLIHDDLQDRDRLRRGQATVWCQFGDEMAINLGDYFIVQTFALVARIACSGERQGQLLALFSRAAAAAIRGQVKEFTALDVNANTELLQRYVATARGKSGALFALPGEAALLLADCPPRMRASLKQALLDYGLLYQILDDLNDLTEQKAGRQGGSDLRQRRLTALAIAFLRRATSAQRRDFWAFLTADSASVSAQEEAFWRHALVESGVVETTHRYARRVKQAVFARLNALPPPLSIGLRYGLEQALAEAGWRL